MKVYLTQSTLVRRLNQANLTIRERIERGEIEPDGILRAGSKEQFIFDAEKLPTIRKALQGPEVQL